MSSARLNMPNDSDRLMNSVDPKDLFKKDDGDNIVIDSIRMNKYSSFRQKKVPAKDLFEKA